MSTTVHGADVSHHQPPLDLAAAKAAGLKFLYHKATEGDSFVDPEYRLRREQAAKAGIPFGAYHFARAEIGDARAEARRFIEVADPHPGDLIPALDLETAEGLTFTQLKRWGRNFADEVEKLVGVRPVLYSPWDFGLGLTRWVPRYNNTGTPPTIPWDIWQFSNGVYGRPNSFPGLGRVDLNTFADGVTLRDIRIPQEKPPKPPRTHRTLHFQHTSMQFSDRRRKVRADAEVIFSRGKDILTGTEAGAAKVRRALRAAAKRHGYRLVIRQSVWVAVRRDLIQGDVEVGYVPVIKAGESRTAPHGDRGIVWISFETTNGLGRVTVGAGHYLTGGRPGQPNHHLNRRFTEALGRWAREHGKGSALVFYGGDQNVSDRWQDTFLGAPLTSAADELEKWRDTGHGPIDVIASYDRDGRVEAKYIRVLDDDDLYLHTDHYLVEAGFRVAILKGN